MPSTSAYYFSFYIQKKLKKGKKTIFKDDGEEDDIDIDIRDDEDEEGKDVNSQEIENFIKTLGLDKYESQ